MRKAAKFQVQVAAASILDDPPPTATQAAIPSTVHPPLPFVRAGKTYAPLHGPQALAWALRKAAKFQAQFAAELPAALSSDDLPSTAVEIDPPPSAAPGLISGPQTGAAPRPVLHLHRARKVLSSPRGQRALELALRKASALSVASVSPAVAVPPVPVGTPSRRFVPLWSRRGRLAALPWTFLAACLATGLFLTLRHREPEPTPILAQPRPSLEWLHQAQDHAADGSFGLALNTVERALVDSPENAALLKFKGDMHQSLFQFGAAQSAYEQALDVDPHSKEAQENLALSRRLRRSTLRPAGKLSALYGLHRAMMAQGRLDEAVAISNHLPTDPELSQATWQAILDRTGLQGRVTVDDQGVMSVDLSGSPLPDLKLIQKFPVRRLSLAGTGLEDLQPLEGMPLEAIDLSHTLVHDLTPLRGMPLQALQIAHTGVVDLMPLKDCPLRELDLSGTRVAGVEALARMPLASLQADGTPLADLRPLATLPLVRLSLSHTRVDDLRPLQHLGLQQLTLDGTNVSDLTPLRDSPLQELSLAHTPVNNLAPLARMPLTVLSLQGCSGVRDLRPLSLCVELEHLHLPPNGEHLEALHELPHLRFIERDSDVKK